MINILQKQGAALDGSDTGTGKTYTSIALAKLLKCKIIALVPKNSISTWQEIADAFEVPIIAFNYEQYQRGNIECLRRTEYMQTFYDRRGKRKKRRVVKFQWLTDKNDLIVFDEAHRCGSYSTLNGKILRFSKKTNSKILSLSATITDKATDMYNIGLVLGLFSDWMGFQTWGYNRGITDGHFGGFDFNASKSNLIKIHNDIYPKYGARMKASEIPGFPKNNIISEAYDMESAVKIQNLYDDIKGIIEITKRIKARQEIELLKVSTMIEMTSDLLAKGHSVCLFVNFKQTITELSKKLKTNCIIDGGVAGKNRIKNMRDFQNNKSKIILLNSRAGGESISLHDTQGGHPRVSIISPPESAKNLKQVFGRTVREGTKADYVTQKIIFCRNTIEEEVAKNLKRKIRNIDMINDGDFGELI
jgi:superfamily II DNA or RNA helicase